MPTMKVRFEKTDTFSGEANYCWAQRHEEYVDSAITDRALVRRAKAWAGWQGLRAQTYINGNGDEIAIHPVGIHQVLFIDWSN